MKVYTTILTLASVLMVTAYPSCKPIKYTNGDETTATVECYGDGMKFFTKCVKYGTDTKCMSTTTYNGISKNTYCIGTNWGTGNGKAKNGECCWNDDDCKDTCNAFICGKSW